MAKRRLPVPVTVLHGGPVVLRRRGSHDERTDLVRMATDCEVASVDDGDLRPLHVPDGPGDAYFVYEGNLWARVSLATPSLRPTVLQPSTFLGLLRDPGLPDDALHLAFRRYFSRTPLCPADELMIRSPAFVAKKAQGEEPRIRLSGTLVADGRDRAAAGMRRLLSESVMVGDAAVYVRCAGLVSSAYDPKARLVRTAVKADGSFDPYHGEPMPTRPSDRRAYHAAMGRDPWKDGPCVRALVDGGLAEHDAEADLRFLANALPAIVLGSLARYGAEVEPDRVGVPGSALPGLRADAFMGMMGDIGGGAVEPSLRRSADALRGHVRHLADAGHSGRPPDCGKVLAPISRFLDVAVLPRLDRLAPGDAEAFRDLAPGR